MKHIRAPTELWWQDAENSTLWHGDKGVIVNDAALREREQYFEIVRLGSPTPSELIRMKENEIYGYYYD